MKAASFFAVFAIATTALIGSAFTKEHEGWSTDVEAAFALAKKENKSVLLEFTGSDWCAPCIAMRKNVFSKKEFIDGASKNFVLVEIDLPLKDKELKAKNQPHADKYKVNSFPTVILLDSTGKEFTRFTASAYPKTEDFLKHLDDSLAKKDLD